jgi:hypothetical protein
MNKNLEIKMNEHVEEFRNQQWRISDEVDGEWSYKEGFKACHDLMIWDMKKLVTALEFYEKHAPSLSSAFWDEDGVDHAAIVKTQYPARQAIQEYKSKWGEG